MTDVDDSTARVDGPGLAREELWRAVSGRDEQAAMDAAGAALDRGVSAEELLLDVIAPVQQRVGAEWAANRISVAQEHAATAINDRVIAVMARSWARSPAETQRGRVTVACVDGEWHALPARLLAEVLRLRGWHVDFLGAQVPTAQLVAHVRDHGPVGNGAVALSCSIPTHLPDAHQAIIACQAVGTSVLVGGPAFGMNGEYARLLGADGWAAGARSAVDYLARRPSSAPARFRTVVDDLGHLADQEFTLISRAAPNLVATLIAAAPGLEDVDAPRRREVTEDLGQFVNFLVASLYVDDADLLLGYVEWISQIHRARGLSSDSFGAAARTLAEQLRDFPRATGILRMLPSVGARSATNS